MHRFHRVTAQDGERDANADHIFCQGAVQVVHAADGLTVEAQDDVAFFQ